MGDKLRIISIILISQFPKKEICLPDRLLNNNFVSKSDLNEIPSLINGLYYKL